MSFQEYFPVWNRLSASHQKLLQDTVTSRMIPKETIVHNGSTDCTGLMLLKNGQLRAYILSEEGREVTIYRLFERDLCLFSASCIMRSIQFDITIETEKDMDCWIIPLDTFRILMEESAPMANYMNEIMGMRLSDAMWLIEQVLWKSMDKRVANFLLEEAAIEETNKLQITHEAVANHLGSHREVITRMLKYLQNEGMVKVSRGFIEIVDEKKLEALRGQ